jgi:hypothetical protein
MIPTFFVMEQRPKNYERDFAVAVWQLGDFMDSAGELRPDPEISPTIVFSCSGLQDAEMLARRLVALRDALESGRQHNDRSFTHE